MNKNTICLWYNHDAEEAAQFYAKTFPNSSVDSVHKAPSNFPGGKAGQVLTVQFTVCSVPCQLTWLICSALSSGWSRKGR